MKSKPMAISNCLWCDRRIPDGMTACPGCGSPFYEAEPIRLVRAPDARAGGQVDAGPFTIPIWVYLVLAVYLILAATVTFGPLVAVVALDGSVGTDRHRGDPGLRHFPPRHPD
jgi:hypothetical protein